MEYHELANLFPMISPTEASELAADIAANGLREPIVTYEGKILDGRNRFEACKKSGVEPVFVEYTGDDPLAFVVSLNLKRRHLSESQRGMVGARIANLPAHRPDNSANLQTYSRAEAAQLLNVSERTVNTAKKVEQNAAPELIKAVDSGAVSVSAAADVAELPKEQQAEIVAKGEREILEAAKRIRAEKAETRRAERIEKINEISRSNAPLSSVGRRYPVIYADPPWRYEHSETENRAIENHYPTMSLDEIKAMPVSDIANEDCILFLWATSPKLHESFQVLDAWGFTYRTCAVWDKQKIGMGYYFRQRHELLLVATRGNPPTPSPANRPASVFSFERGEHSAKPVEFYELIESMYPEFDKIELFSRNARDGWGAWGNQA